MVLSDDATCPLSGISNIIVYLHMPIVNIIMLIFSKGYCHLTPKQVSLLALTRAIRVSLFVCLLEAEP